jgi:hypothetical protein
LQGRNRQSPSPPQASAEEQTSRSAAKSKKTRPPVNQQTLHSAIKSKKTAPLVNAKPTVEQLLEINLALEKKLQQYKGKCFYIFKSLISDFIPYVMQRSNVHDHLPISSVSLDQRVRQEVKRKVLIYLRRWGWLQGRMGRWNTIKCMCVLLLFLLPRS